MKNRSANNMLVILPAYNEEKTIETVINDLRENGFSDILVVDDGSTDRTYEITTNMNIYVARHLSNRGLGSALATGFAIARIIDPRIIVTFDADGQHDARDIKKLIRPIENNEADIVIGSRLLAKAKMPLSRILCNKIANIATFMLYGFTVSDTQSGLRALNRKAYQTIEIETSKMECSSEIIFKIRESRLRYEEIGINPIYTGYSLSKGQGFIRGVKTFVRLVLSRLLRR